MNRWHDLKMDTGLLSEISAIMAEGKVDMQDLDEGFRQISLAAKVLTDKKFLDKLHNVFKQITPTVFATLLVKEDSKLYKKIEAILEKNPEIVRGDKQLEELAAKMGVKVK